MNVISSKNNPVIKEICSLEQKKYRDKLGIFFVEGEKFVREAIRLVPKTLRNVLVAEDKIGDFEFLNEVEKEKIVATTPQVFSYISNTKSPQGIACVLQIPRPIDFDFSRPFLVLDHIQDPGNLGTILRSALATNFLDIFLIDCVDPFSDKVVRSSASSIFSVNIFKIKREDFVTLAMKNKVKLLIAEAGKKSVFDEDISIPKIFGLVIGNEGEGVSADILKIGHMSLSLPMNKNIESLNASISASILMYVITNKRGGFL